MNAILKPRRESGFTMIDLLVWMIVVGILMAVAMQGIFTYSNIVKNSQIKAVGKVMQQWSVANPDKPLPVTNNYIDLVNLENEWLPKNVNFSGDIVGNDTTRKIRIARTGTSVSDFVICSYIERTRKRTEIDYMLYNSATDKIEKDTQNVCK